MLGLVRQSRGTQSSEASHVRTMLIFDPEEKPRASAQHLPKADEKSHNGAVLFVVPENNEEDPAETQNRVDDYSSVAPPRSLPEGQVIPQKRAWSRVDVERHAPVVVEVPERAVCRVYAGCSDVKRHEVIALVYSPKAQTDVVKNCASVLGAVRQTRPEIAVVISAEALQQAPDARKSL
jgi:hypothetical protein